MRRCWFIFNRRGGAAARDFALEARKFDWGRVAMVAIADSSFASLIRYAEGTGAGILDHRYSIVDLTNWRGDRFFALFRHLVLLCRRLLGQAQKVASPPGLLAELRFRAGSVDAVASISDRSILRRRLENERVEREAEAKGRER